MDRKANILVAQFNFYFRNVIRYFKSFMFLSIILLSQNIVCSIVFANNATHSMQRSIPISSSSLEDYDFWSLDYNSDGNLDVWVQPKSHSIFLANTIRVYVEANNRPWVILSTKNGFEIIKDTDIEVFDKINKSLVNHLFAIFNNGEISEWSYSPTLSQNGWLASIKNNTFQIKNLSKKEFISTLSKNTPQKPSDQKITSSLNTTSMDQAITIQASAQSVIQADIMPINAVGSLPGEPQVSATGSFQYVIPIAIPPVEGKIQPDLKIAYDSSLPATDLGLGFRLQTGSIISRCAKIKAIDGINQSIAYDSTDVFCLDGQRLIAKGNNRYVPEVGNDILEVQAQIVFSSGPIFFKVYFNNGRVATYGINENSRLIRSDGQSINRSVTTENPIFSWSISSIEDNFGHRVNYLYEIDALKGIQRISEINYDNYKVLFLYETARWPNASSTTKNFIQNPPVILASGGPIIRQGDLLSRIEVHGLTGLINVNHLNYSFNVSSNTLSQHQSAKLTSVQQCSSQRCQKPTRFSWNEESAAFSSKQASWAHPIAYNKIDQQVRHVQWGDFNGDGTLDVYYVYGKKGATDPLGADQDRIYITQPDQTQVEWKGLTTYSYDAVRRLIFGDFNGDGLTDIYYAGNGADYEKLVASRTGPQVEAYEIVNQSDTGKIYFSQGDGTFKKMEGPKISWADSTYPLRMRVGDFNGDGIQDLYHIRGNLGTTQSNAIYAFKADGTYQTIVVPGYGLTISSVWIGVDLQSYTFADFNADGITDLYKQNIERGTHNIVGGHVDRIYEFNSNAQIAKSIDIKDIHYSMRVYDADNPNTTSADLSRFKWQDFNGDGRTDVYYIEGDNNTATDSLYISLGNGRFSKFSGITKFMPNYALDHRIETARYQLIDWNGDGLVDFHRLPARGQSGETEVFLAQPQDKTWFSQTPVKTSFSFTVDIDGGLALSDLARLFHLDLNSDGRQDIYQVRRWNSSTPTNTMHLVTAKPRLVTAINNGLNANVKIEFESLTSRKNSTFVGKSNSYPYRHHLFPMNLVSKIAMDGGITGFNETTYQYDKSLSHAHHGWLGFGSISQTRIMNLQKHSSTTGGPVFEKITQINKSYYLQDPDQRLTGVLKESQRIIDGKNIQTSYFDYQTQVELINNMKIFFPKMIRSQTATWDLNGLFTGATQKNWTYEQNKLLSESECIFSTNQSVISRTIAPCQSLDWIKESITQHQYHLGYSRAYHDGISLVDNSLISKTTVLQKANTQYIPHYGIGWPTHAADQHQQSTYFHYELNNGLLAKTVLVDQSDVFQIQTNFKYDADGFLILKSQIGKDFPARNEYYLYDDQSRLIEQTNALGHKSKLMYQDLRFPWKATTTIDANGLYALSRYDDFGETEQTTNALGINTLVERGLCPTSCQFGEIFWKKTSSIGTPTQWEWFDNLGRVVRKQMSGWLGLIESRTFYNSEGQVSAQSQPRYLTQSELFKKLDYDALGRVTQERSSNGAIQTQSYSGLQTQIFDAKWHAVGGLALPSMKQIMDARGLLITSVDGNNGIINYQYDVRGLIARTYMPGNLKIDTFYNWSGHKIKTQHPDQGTWNYTYNALGQVLTQTDAKQNIQSFTYDLLGRTLTHTTAEGITRWIYDAGENAIGQVVRVEHPNVARQFRYDSLSRVHTTQTRIDTTAYEQFTQYDELGRVEKIIYPNNVAIGYQYHGELGYLIQKNDLKMSRTLWQLKELDAQGRITQNYLGNGLWITNYYDQQTGALIGNKSTLGAQIKTYFDYTYDIIGNLTSRYDNQNTLSESFQYDVLSRLKQSHSESAGIISQTQVTYDGLGNILTKSDIGTYKYGISQNISTQVRPGCYGGPNAVIAVNDKNFCYDANGNLIQDDVRTIQFNSENLATSIRNVNGSSSLLFYGPSKELVKRQDTNNNGMQTEIIYLGDLEIIKKTSQPIEYRYRVGSEATLLVTSNNLSTIQAQFHILDHLGSVVGLFDINGNLENQYSYDAWGKRRNINWQPSINTILYGAWLSAPGFTSHEHLDAVGLIHMNGRIYNPAIGRFISADPLIQSPTDLQSYNSYSYARNNALKYVDPTGYSWISKQWHSFTNFFEKNWKTIVIVGAVLITAGLATTYFAAMGYGKVVVGVHAAIIGAFTANLLGGMLNGASFGDSLRAGILAIPQAAVIGFIVSATLDALYRALTPVEKMRAQLYKVENGKSIPVDPSAIDGEMADIFINGQSNDFNRALKLSSRQMNSKDFYLIHNDTVNGFADTIESMLDKLTGQSPISKDVSQILNRFNLTNSHIVAHSQGTIITRNALSMLNAQGVDLAGLRVTMNGAAVNKLSTQIVFNRMDVNLIGFNAHSLDAVPNIIGYNAITIPNPYRLVGSILASPLLGVGGDWSPHTYPGGGANLSMFPSWY